MSHACQHTLQIGREGHKGTWCQDCGEQVLDVDPRECKDCKHYSDKTGRSICKKHLMGVTPTMHVTFHIAKGTCWEDTE